MTTSSPASQFGPNEWMVEEMYERFLADPQSVDSAWHDFFADFTPTQTDGSPGTGAKARVTQAPAAQSPAPRPAASTAGSAARATASSAGNGENREPEWPKTPEPAAKSTPAPARPAAPAKSAQPAPRQEQQDTKLAEGDDAKVLRGISAAIAKNMDASLAVPTATSVRAVPAKLMADNRIVINNHLKRTRGGKISFTHLIGYAMIRALRDYPNMNRHYALLDGKPNAITPEHVNLGLAIDMKGKDGSRNLVVASIKNVEDMSFLQFWQ
ncbi:MAG: 2-oxo acid dehydrogenase subunit E2, partial [Thermocrispum sp.]